MIRNIANRLTSQFNGLKPLSMFSSSSDEGSSFLKMVDSYFDKASVHTGIR